MNVKLKKLFILTLIIILMVGGCYFLARTDYKILPAGFFSDIIFTIPGRRPPEGSRESLRDVPSGVREDLKGFSINGISATSFYSKSLELGDTWEIWFIREGYLYEITTFRGLETWLGDILSTWQFIP